jgi:hypothetical protein
MDKFRFMNGQSIPQPSAQPNIFDALSQARRNPQAFEEHMRKNNPQAYQQAMQIRNSGNARSAVMQMLQSKGINHSILQMLGLR